MSDNTPVVNPGDVTTPEATPVAPQEPTKGEEPGKEPAQPGSKTDPALLLESLKEERDKRKKDREELASLREELNTLKSSSLSEEVYTEEGKVLQDKIAQLTQDLKKVKDDGVKSKLLEQYPVLKERWSEFEEFRNNDENKGMALSTAAKAYLVEQGVFEPQRKGLEKSTGGQKIPPTPEMTAEQVADLRKNNHNKYRELIKKGQLPKLS